MWEEINTLLVWKSRIDARREPEPSYSLAYTGVNTTLLPNLIRNIHSLIVSRSAKTTGYCEECGYDGGINERTQTSRCYRYRRTLTTYQNPCGKHSDTKEGATIMQAAINKYPIIESVCGDAGYRGTFVEEIEKHGLQIDIVERLGSTWELLPKRWRVERTFSWVNKFSTII